MAPEDAWRHHDYALLVAAGGKTIIQQISKRETAHVALLQATITKLVSTPVASPEFDFTAGGAYDPFGDYPTFLILARFEKSCAIRSICQGLLLYEYVIKNQTNQLPTLQQPDRVRLLLYNILIT